MSSSYQSTSEVSRRLRRLADAKRRIKELESINEGLLIAFDQFLRDEGYSDEEAGGFLYPWISKVKEQPR